MGNAINAKLIKKEGEAPKGALAVNVYGDIGGEDTLPTASADTLGGVKVGSGLAIDSNGVLSASGGSNGGVNVVTYTETPSGVITCNHTFEEIAQLVSDNKTIIIKYIKQVDEDGDILSYEFYGNFNNWNYSSAFNAFVPLYILQSSPNYSFNFLSISHAHNNTIVKQSYISSVTQA